MKRIVTLTCCALLYGASAFAQNPPGTQSVRASRKRSGARA